MGIQGLLPLLKDITEKTNLGALDLRGKRIAFDAMALLHRGSIACAREVCLGLATSRYVSFCRGIIKLFLDQGVQARDCYMVFDNKVSPPLKLETNDGRRIARAMSLEKAAAEERRLGPTPEVCSLYKSAVAITAEMIAELHQACLGMGLNVVFAPNEADAQVNLFYLS